MEHIVILDSEFMILEEDWLASLKSLGSVVIHHSTSKENIHERVSKATIIFANRTPINKGTIDAAPNLKYMGIMSTGYNSTDIHYAREKNIVVANAPSYSTKSVAQLAFTLILERASRFTDFTQFVERGDWSRGISSLSTMNKMQELQGKTLGIYGFGEIGQEIGMLGKAFGMNIIYNTRAERSDFGYDAEFVTFDELLKRSDFLSLNSAVGEKNKYIFNKSAFKKMKSTAFLINTARGFLVESHDLAEALNNGDIAGASLDVIAPNEPPREDNPLLTAKNCIIIPHVAWGPVEARKRLEKITFDNLKAFLDGHPVNVVN